jgi:hypothetical protein
MYYKLIGCKIMEREIASLIYNCKNIIDVSMIRKKLHDTPLKLHDFLQAEIDLIDQNQHNYSNDTSVNDYDAILLAYGLCSNVVCGLSSKKYPLVIPRAHDCVSLIMGSKEKYLDYYKAHPGTFYYWPAFSEERGPNEDERWRRRYAMYLERYHGDQKRAEKVMRAEDRLTINYNEIAYIDWPELIFPEYEQKARELAETKNWNYNKITGSNSILKRLVDGDWPEEDFLVVRPGHHAEPSYEKSIIKEV